jgi:hypothetical protein
VDADAGERHRDFGKAANGRTWELLGTPSRTPAEDREMVAAAYASLWHWLHGGDAVNEQRGEWLISHVYAVLRDGPNALAHARRCWEISEHEGLDDFDLAYACEAMARALALEGDDSAADWRRRGEAAGSEIKDLEDREIFEDDLAAGPW